MKMRARVAITGALVGLGLLAFTVGALTAGPLFAQTPTPTPAGVMTHEQMDQMMDAVHGPGTSQRMHEAMGPDAEKLMDQCVSMMGMMQNMQGMMGTGMSGAMGGMSGMMGSQNGQSMPEMMNRMMGR